MKQLINLIKKSKRVAVFTHVSADADACGSFSAISFLCKHFNKHVDCFIDDKSLNDKFACIPFEKYSNSDITENYDLVIAVDVASKHLLGKYADYFTNHPNSVIIDHHCTRNLYGKHNFIENCSSCGEIITKLIKKYYKNAVKNVYTCLYAAVADDTGCFCHDNTTALTHKTAAFLMEKGADFNTVNYWLFKFISEKTFKTTKLLYDNIVHINGLTYCIVPSKFLAHHKATSQDLGDFCNLLINLENTKIAFLATQKDNGGFKINLRAIKGYNVAEIAVKFNGGGHNQSAGCFINGTADEVANALIDACMLYLNNL